MHPFEQRVLGALRRRISRPVAASFPSAPDVTGEAAANQIRTLLEGANPAMITRFGANELDTLARFHRKVNFTAGAIRIRGSYILGTMDEFFFSNDVKRRMEHVAGFFPVTDIALEKFCRQSLADLPLVDLLGSWRPEESLFREMMPDMRTCQLRDLEPYFAPTPWTTALEGRKVLVIHPFVDSIQAQYRRRELLFKDKRMLPPFELSTIKAVQSLAKEKTEFNDWFEAFYSMANELDKRDFDVALIGAGAYGMPLAAHVKRLGKKAVHLGGALQVMFGIKGGRWDERPEFQALYNEYWIRPSETERPVRAELVEAACYW